MSESNWIGALLPLWILVAPLLLVAFSGGRRQHRSTGTTGPRQLDESSRIAGMA
jgi:hypothetical protein